MKRKSSLKKKYLYSATTVGQYLLDRLQQNGVQHIFGVPGDYILRFDKLIEQHSIQFINATRENTAGYMADAYARFRGLGAVCITYGVGINITNAISQAYVENSPVVLISGAPSLRECERCPYLHHLIPKILSDLVNTQYEIFKNITVDQAILSNPATAASNIDRVLNNCLAYKKPVYLELPRDIVGEEIPTHHAPRFSEKLSDPESFQELLDEVAEILHKSRSPVLWVGHEVQRYGIAAPLLKFAEKFHIPMVSSLLGKTVISEHHPLFVGVYQGAMSRPEVNEFLNRCDCIFILGVILSDVDTGMFSTRFKTENRIISNSDHTLVRNHYFKNIAFPELIGALAELPLTKSFKAKFPASIHRQLEFSPRLNTAITTARVFECIQSHLRPESIVVTDFGDCLFGSVDFILEQNSFLASAYFGTLGFGVPGAIAAQLAQPQRRVIGVVGDGAFQMTCTELSTAVRYHLDPIIIVLNNHGYGTERPLLEGSYNDIVEWNYMALPALLGAGIGVQAPTEEALDRELTAALKRRNVFTLIEVEVDKLDFSPTMQRFFSLVKRTKET